MINPKGRELLLYLALKYDGEWDKICAHLTNKNPIIDEEYERLLNGFNMNYVTIMDENYPTKLKKVFKPPFILFYYGDLSLIDGHTLGVVGARNCSEYGIDSTYKIIKELQNKLVIVSGLAKGIDAAAHKAIIESGGKTIAVLGSGIDYCYPYENRAIYEEIKRNHLLISEYPFNSTPRKHHFPYRNRLIGAIGDALLVTEAMEGSSGTYHTIRATLELGKEVYCVPYLINKGALTNRLIQEGAMLVEEGRDILEDMKIY